MQINKAIINAFLDGKLSYSEAKDLEILFQNDQQANQLLEVTKIERDLIKSLIPEFQMNGKEEQNWADSIKGILDTVEPPSKWEKFKETIKFLS